MSTLRALHAHGYTLIGADAAPYCAASDLLSCFYQIPLACEANYLSSLQQIVDKHKITVLFPIAETEILAIANHEQGVKRCNIAIHPHEIVNIFLNKAKTSLFFQQLGYNAPKTFFIEGYDNSLPYPIIAKPNTGCGSKNIHILHNSKGLEQLVSKQPQGLILQEYIGCPEEEYTTGVFSDGIHTSSITFKRKLVSGYSQEVRPVHDTFMEGLAKKLAQQINLKGCLNIQTRKIGKEHFVFEVNPRISSTVMFRSLFGFHDAHWWAQYFLGKGYTYSMQNTNHIGIRYLKETILPL